MFESMSAAAPDAIFGLNDAMARDPRPDKINLGAGVYKDDDGVTPVLEVVQEAERRLLEAHASKTYLPIDGLAAYDRLVMELLLGEDHGRIRDEHVACVQTPGGTGALRVAADLLARHGGGKAVWLSDPTWPNHPKVFAAAGLETRTYSYFDPASNGPDFKAMCRDLEKAQPGDLVVLHGCCHNPTGVDLNAEQQTELGELLAEHRLVPLMDFAYQGFSQGVEEDAHWLRRLAEQLPEVLVASSFSKNFGLYNERTGALTAVAGSSKALTAALSRIKQVVRSNYSNPPFHGAAIVHQVLSDPDLRRRWLEELATMRSRIRDMRQRLADGLDARDVKLHPTGNQFIAAQNGMFSFSRLRTSQVRALRDDHGIYALDSGRINVAGITTSNVDRLCDAVAAVLAR